MSNITTATHFLFETDFMEENIRCIPMIVRFKLDTCGIKLKLKEWSKMTVEERENLVTLPCRTPEQTDMYKRYLQEVIFARTGNQATEIPVIKKPAWFIQDELPFTLEEKLREFNWSISIDQWKSLSDLQRFALVKLSYPGHENANFPKAMKEFGLV